MHDGTPRFTPRPSLARRLLPHHATATQRIIGLTTLSFAVIGAVTGLVVGLCTYAPTAPVAVFEAGIPAALLGLLVGALLAGVRWCRLAALRDRPHPR